MLNTMLKLKFFVLLLMANHVAAHSPGELENLVRSFHLRSLAVVNSNFVRQTGFLAGRSDGAYLNDADFSDFSSTELDISGAQIGRSQFTRANIPNALFVKVRAIDADFSYANLSGTNFEQSRITRSNFESANMQSAGMHGANLESSDFLNAVLAGSCGYRTNFSYALLQRTKINNASFVEGKFDHADLSWANLKNSDFTRASFRYADFTAVRMEKTYLHGADFTGATHFVGGECVPVTREWLRKRGGLWINSQPPRGIE